MSIQSLGLTKPIHRIATLGGLVSLIVTHVGTQAAVAVVTAWAFFSTLMYLPHNQMAQAITDFMLAQFVTPQVQMAKSIRPAATALAKARKPANVMILRTADLPDSNAAYLHTFVRNYTAVFTGKVDCGGAACSSLQVEIHVASKKTPAIVKSATVSPDGTYEASVLVKETPNNYLDWWIVAGSPDSANKQVQGRQILMNDRTVKIEEQINLL